MYDNALGRRSRLCWCDNWRQDWTEIHLYGLQRGLFRIALHLTGRAAMHLVVPNLTEQDCVVLDSTAVSCSRLDETEMSRGVTDCTALHCTALHCTALQCTRLNCCWLIWTWAIVDWNVLRWKRMNGIGRKRIDLSGTELDWKGRDGNRLHLMDWTGWP